MPNRITPGQIKKTNRQLIYEYIYQKRHVTQQEISYALRLSRPTITSNITDLEEDGMIYKSGRQDSDQIGRKAIAYSVVPDFRISIGAEIMADMVKIIAVDLYGEKIERIVKKIPYRNQESYYKEVSDSILTFLKTLKVSYDRILGIGFAMQGLVSADRRTIVYGKIMENSGVTIDVFSRYLPFPCSFIHDSDGAALSELWISPELTDAIYLSLSKHLGGSIINKRSIMSGKHGHTATFEHIRIRPRGELCYCGSRGCLETLCSMSALLGKDDAEDFFHKVRSGAPEQGKRWRVYLKNLALMIDILHLIHDMDFILGGHLAPYFMEEDIQFIYDEIQRSCPFEDSRNFILISKMPSHNIAIGATLPYIQDFLKDIGPARAMLQTDDPYGKYLEARAR